MSSKESKCYVINFKTPGYLFLKLTPRTMKCIFRYRIKKVSRKEGRRCVQGL